MSENLKRAESLFNRIMKQNASISNPSLTRTAGDGPTGGNGNGGGRQSGHHHHKYTSHKNTNRHHHYNYSTQSGTSNANSNVTAALPKKDPIKAADDTIAKIPSDHHILPYCWTIWYHSRSKPKKETDEDPKEETPAPVGVDTYLYLTKEIEFLDVNSLDKSNLVTSIGSIEQLWVSLSSIKKTYHLPIGTELLVFKSGINPVWEDPINAKGGRWVFRFNRRYNLPAEQTNVDSIKSLRQRSSLIWERLLLKTMTGSIIPDGDYTPEVQDILLNDITGLVLSVRKDDDIISIWNANLNFNKKKPSDDDDKKKLTSFQARRIICDLILRVVREVDLIMTGSNDVFTVDTGSNERVQGVSFEYRMHADSNNPVPEKYGRRYKQHRQEEE